MTDGLLLRVFFQIIPSGQTGHRCLRPVAYQKESLGTKAKVPFQTSHHMTRLHTRASSFLLAQHHLLKTHLPADTMHTCALTLKHKPCLILELGNVSRALRAPFVTRAATAPLDQETCTLPQPADRHQDEEEPRDVVEQPVDLERTAPEEQPDSTLSPAEKVPRQTPGAGSWLAGFLAGRSGLLKRASHTSSSGATLPSCLQLLLLSWVPPSPSQRPTAQSTSANAMVS